MKIRLLKPSDIPQASKIVGLNYSPKYEKSSFKEMEAMSKNYVVNPQYLVAEEKGKIVGLAWYIQSRMDYNIYNILRVNVSPLRQGKWIGTQLIQKIIGSIKKKKWKMILLTTTKPKFYSKKFGFKSLKKFNSNKNDLMFLSLEK